MLQPAVHELPRASGVAFVLNLDGIGRFVVPFGVERGARGLRGASRAGGLGGDSSDEANATPNRGTRGLIVDASVAEQVMRMVCANVTCFMPLDVAPLSLNVTGMAPSWCLRGSPRRLWTPSCGSASRRVTVDGRSVVVVSGGGGGGGWWWWWWAVGVVVVVVVGER